MSGDWADLANRLYQQGGRQGEADQAYRQAIAAGNTEAWLSLGNLRSGSYAPAGARADA